MKFLAIGVVVLFIGYWMVETPDSLARFTDEGAAWLWDTATMVFRGAIDFLTTLFA